MSWRIGSLCFFIMPVQMILSQNLYGLRAQDVANYL
jgi:hypothetical protein